VKALARLSIALVAPLALLAPFSGAALGSTPGFDLQISVPNAVHVGQPAVAQVAGHNPPPGSYTYLSWLEVDLLRPEAVKECPASTAGQVAANTGGAILTIASREEAEISTGAFTVPVGFTPLVSGPLLLCAYSYNEVGFTWTSASYTVNVIADAPAKPAATGAPRVSRIGNRLVCDPGGWSAAPTSFRYRWVLDGRRAVASGRTLGVTRKLRGHELQCSVTATNAAGSTNSRSKRFLVR
jgi:hypothetical protein